MTKSIIMYKNSRNNEAIRFPSPSERIEKSLIMGGVIVNLTGSGSISIRKSEACNTYLLIDTDGGTKSFKVGSSKTYDVVKGFFPEHCPGYNSEDIVNLGCNIIVKIASNGITVTFDTVD